MNEISPSFLKRQIEILEKVKSTSSPIEKKVILGAAKTDAFLQEIFFYTYNPFYRYWIKTPSGKPNPNEAGTVGWPMFREILDGLRGGAWRGADADAVVSNFINRAHPKEADLYLKILDRDLGVGVGVQILLDVYGDGFIPTFEVMKAKKIEDGVEPTFPCIIEPKLDGVRCFVVKSEDKVTLWSRRGHTFENYPQIASEIAEIPGDFILDGELVGRGSFQSTMSQVRRKYNVDTSDTLLTVFDGFSMDNYPKGSKIVNLSFSQRRSWLENLLVSYVGNNLELIDSMETKSWEDAQIIYNEFLEKGYEGAMLKDPNAPYYFKRHKAWLKMKPTDTLDLKIIGFQEGEGKYKGLLGAIVVELPVYTPIGNAGFEVRVGGGFSDSQRADLWNIRRSLLGTLIEVKFDRVTINDSGGYSLRFPRFVRLRPDKTETDIIHKGG